MKNIIKEHGFIDIKKLRENTDLSRKYCIAYLEYLDNLNDIVKDGDKRKLKYWLFDCLWILVSFIPAYAGIM